VIQDYSFDILQAGVDQLVSSACIISLYHQLDAGVGAAGVDGVVANSIQNTA
jgi:hypothetical protein